MPRRRPEPRHVGVGRRVSLRRILADGGQGDLVGFVAAVAADGLTVRDRRGADHVVAWPDVLALRPVGVARGRDPLRAPRAELDRLAASAGVSGRVFVARLCDLLDVQPPPVLGDWDDPPPCLAALDGEWVTTGECADVLALAWWAAHHDARSIQVRTDDASAAEALRRGGFHEIPTQHVSGQS
nr:hypothetical protein [Propionicimonas sp.]